MPITTHSTVVAHPEVMYNLLRMAQNVSAGRQEPGSARRSSEHTSSTSDSKLNQNAFVGIALGMSWQLAVIVLVPILGGYKLDGSFNSAPWLTLIGLLLSIVGSILVVRRSLAQFGNFDVPANTKAIHKYSDDEEDDA